VLVDRLIGGTTVTMTLFTKLDTEWRWLAACRRSTRELDAWRRTDSVLDPFTELDGLVRFTRSPGHPAESDAVLHCLARRTHHSSLAARTLLQAIVYGLVRIAADFKNGADSDDEAASLVVATAYERIRTYPVARRPQHIAANVLLDTRQTVSRTLFRPRVEQILVGDLPITGTDAAERSAADELLALVDIAMRSHVISADDARLIISTRVAGIPLNDIAAARGLHAQSLRRRRLRAEACLADAALNEAVA
jgi:hypothetical protein